MITIFGNYRNNNVIVIMIVIIISNELRRNLHISSGHHDFTRAPNRLTNKMGTQCRKSRNTPANFYDALQNP